MISNDVEEEERGKDEDNRIEEQHGNTTRQRKDK
jgi:hypothetical protein